MKRRCNTSRKQIIACGTKELIEVTFLLENDIWYKVIACNSATRLFDKLEEAIKHYDRLK